MENLCSIVAEEKSRMVGKALEAGSGGWSVGQGKTVMGKAEVDTEESVKMKDDTLTRTLFKASDRTRIVRFMDHLSHFEQLSC